MSTLSATHSRETVADALSGLTPEQQSFLNGMMENPDADDLVLDGLHLYLDRASAGPFLNSLKLQKCGDWLGNAAPARLQIRVMEASKSSQHPAFAAFREGYQRSGGFDRAYPKAPV